MSMLPAAIEHGEPHADARAFRRCLGQFATGVAVMTAQHDGQLAGIVVNSFASLSLDPPLILWSIRRESASLPLFCQAGRFAVNVLSADQLAVSNRFAAARNDKFSGIAWTPGRHGAPLLAGCLAHLECLIEQTLDGGDHLLIVGRVKRYARFGGEPLLFAQGHYAVAQEHPALSVPAA